MRVALFALFALLFAAPARADVPSSSPGAFVVMANTQIVATNDEAWDAMLDIGRWWSPAHSYSGDARRMTLEPRAGGCWCERWNGQSVEHARVVAIFEADGVRTLRLVGALGPLQDMGAYGVLTMTITPSRPGSPQAALVTWTYRVSGDPALQFDQIAPAVNNVLGEQIVRLSRYVETGTPD